MKTWFMSLNGAVTLSVITLLMFLDALFVMKDQMREDQPLTIGLTILGKWSSSEAGSGRRFGLQLRQR